MKQSGWFLTDITGIISGLDNIVIFPIKVLESYSKELNNIDTKKYKNNKNKNNLYIDAGLIWLAKDLRKIWFRNDSSKQWNKRYYESN